MQKVLFSSDQAPDSGAPGPAMLRNAGFEVVFPADREFARGLTTEDQNIAQLRGVAAVVAWSEAYSRNVLSALPDLRVVARAGVGYDQVDVAAAIDRNIVVTITPTANYEAVAEHTMALILAVAKSIVSCDKDMRSGGWPGSSRTPIRGTTLGIVGLGRIGRSTAVRARAMRMNVIAAELVPDTVFAEEHDIELVDLDTLLTRADYVSLHCPLSDNTRGMMHREKFALMKQDSVFINTARGGLVVERDLVEVLSSGRLRAAGLDVFEREPTRADNPLFAFDNVVVSSHKAGDDVLAVENMGIEAVQSIIDLSQGRWPDGAVINTELKESFRW